MLVYVLALSAGGARYRLEARWWRVVSWVLPPHVEWATSRVEARVTPVNAVALRRRPRQLGRVHLTHRALHCERLDPEIYSCRR